MPIIGVNAAASIAGAQQAAAAIPRTPKHPSAASKKRERDAFVHIATPVDSGSAVRELADNSQEDANEDRQAHGDAEGQKQGTPPKPHLDMEG